MNAETRPVAGAGQLSCYSTGLLAYLGRNDPCAAARMAAAVRLDVRTDLPDGPAFLQHARIDNVGGRGLRNRGSGDPGTALDGIAGELGAAGAVIAVTNTAALPWSPAYRQITAPHWVLLTGRERGRWLLEDPMDALLPGGTQHPFTGRITDADLIAMMTMPGELPDHLVRRDRYALGAGLDVPHHCSWRWLSRGPACPTPSAATEAGQWVRGTAPALRSLAELLAEAGPALERSAEDLWAAARHHLFRLGWLAGRGTVTGQDAGQVAAAWADLPRAVRFAADSARRGRPRPGLVRTALVRLAEQTERIENPNRVAHAA